MSVEVYSPEGFPGAEPGSQVGTVSNGRLKWAPSWYTDGWADEEQQEAFVEWLGQNPDAEVPTDCGTWPAALLLTKMEGAVAGPTVDDLREVLRRSGRL